MMKVSTKRQSTVWTRCNRGLAASFGALASPKTRNAPLLLGPFFFVWNGPHSEVPRFEISTREPNFEPLSWFGLSFLGVKKTSKCERTKKTNEKPNGSTKNACCLTHDVTKLCFLSRESVFPKLLPSHFALCCLPFAERSQKSLMGLGGSKLGFGETSWPIIRARNFGVACVTKQEVFPQWTPTNMTDSWRRRLGSPCAPWRNAPLWNAPCYENVKKNL